MWYPSRERILQLSAELAHLEKATFECDAHPEAFLSRISSCIRHLAINEIVPPSCLRDWIWIGSQYRINKKQDNRAHAVARRTLLYLEKSLNTPAPEEAAFRREINWIADSAVSDLRAEMGPNEYSSFLSSEELEKLEERLCTLRVNALPLSAEDDRLLDAYLAHFADMSSETYLPGIAEMLSRLKKAARNDSENQAAAIACLRYVLKRQDVVPDSLGYLGLVDDIYAIEQTYREIENRSTWAPLLEQFNFEFPYVARVAFDDGGTAVRCSPFMQTVFGTALHSLRREGQKACLVVPETGINGLIGAFLATVESIRGQAAKNGTDRDELVPGEDIVLGDTGKIVRARYLTEIEYEGKTYSRIELKQGGKQTVSRDVLWFARRSPKPHRFLSSTADYNDWKKEYCPTSLTHLVGQDFRFDDLKPEVLLLTRRNQLDDQLPQIRPMGSTIAQLVGMRYVTSSGIEVNLPGTTLAEPLIWSCSDAPTARELITSKDSPLSPRYVIAGQADLAAELEDILPTDGQVAPSSRVAFSGLHEREDASRLVRRNYETWLLRQSDVDLVPGWMSRSAGRSDGIVSRYQKRQATQTLSTISIYEVECEPVEYLYEHIQLLRQEARRADDPQLDVITIAASTFIRRFSGTPFEFNEMERDELRRLLDTLVGHCGVLADFSRCAADLLAAARTMLGDELPANPKHAALLNIIADSGPESLAVLCRSAHDAGNAGSRAAKEPRFAQVKWLSVQQLRGADPFERLIVPGWIARATMREIRNCGYARHLDLLFYGFEREWEVRSTKAGQAWERRLETRMNSQWSAVEKEFGELPRPLVVSEAAPELLEHAEEALNDDLLEERITESIRSRVLQESIGKELSEARLVAFETPGSYVYLPPHGSVISLSRALEAISEQAGKKIGASGQQAERLVNCPVSEIQRGDLLAFPTDRNTDLLDTLANGFIPDPDETRRLAGLWRKALLDHVEQTNSDVHDLQVQLENAGLKRHPLTVRTWIAGTQIIAPMNYQEAISAIGEVTGHNELNARIDQVKSAIDLVYRARGRAAEQLLAQLANRNVEFQQGMASVTVQGHRIDYLLHRVLSIDPPADVPRDEIGIPKNITDLPPRSASSQSTRVEE